MQVRLNPTIVASDASGAVSIARSLEREANSLAGRLSGTSGMAGIDPMAEEFALGSKDEGGYDASVNSQLRAALGVASMLGSFESTLTATAKAYRDIELVGANGGSNWISTASATTIGQYCPSVGTALGNENLGTPGGEIMEFIENFLKDTAGIVIPTADTDAVGRAESAWTDYAGALDGIKSEVSSMCSGVSGMEFPQQESVLAIRDRLATLVGDVAEDGRGMAEVCRSYASNVNSIRDELRSMLVQLAVEVALDIGIGIALSFVSFGAGALAGAAKAATTIARWVPRFASLINRLKTLVMTAKRTMAIMRRVAIEAIEGSVSGVAASSITGLSFGNFSWSNVGASAIGGSVGGVFSGPFSNIGTRITSRTGRIATTSVIGGLSGAGGGVAGDFLASQATGQQFNLLMSALVGTAGGTAGGGVGNIKSPTAPTPNAATPVTPSTGGSSKTPGDGAAIPTPGAATSAAPSTGGSSAPKVTTEAPTVTGGTPAPGSSSPGGGTAATPPADAPNVPATLPTDGPTSTPVDVTPTPVDTTPAPVDTTPTPVDTTPAPVDTTPAPVDTTPAPVDTTPAPADTTPAPVDTTPAPVDTTPAPVDTTPAPVDTAPAPVDTTPAPVDVTPAPVDTTPPVTGEGDGSGQHSGDDVADAGDPDGGDTSGDTPDADATTSPADTTDTADPSSDPTTDTPPVTPPPASSTPTVTPPHRLPPWIEQVLSPRQQEIIAGTDPSGPSWRRWDEEDVELNALNDYPNSPNSGPSVNPGPTPALDPGAPTVDANGNTVPGPAADLLRADPTQPFGHDRHGNPLDQTNHSIIWVDQNGNPLYPPNNGAVPGTRVQYRSLADFLRDFGNLQTDRLGHPNGDFMGIGGGTLDARGLPTSQMKAQFFSFVDLDPNAKLPPGVGIEVSMIADALGRDGGGLQVVFVDLNTGQPIKLNDPLVSGLISLETYGPNAQGVTPTGSIPGLRATQGW